MEHEKPNAQDIERNVHALSEVELEFDAARDAALKEVKEGDAKAAYQFRDNIPDGAHLKHLTITRNNGEIIYDEDFELEDAVTAQRDTHDN